MFTTERAGPLLKQYGIVCPEFDEAVFTRCLKYAVSVHWGAESVTRSGAAEGRTVLKPV